MSGHGGAYDSSILLSANVASASGATNTITSYTDSSGDKWRVYTFLESGNFTTDVVSKCDVLVVAGGGGGGGRHAGGGGAGGLVFNESASIDAGTYTVTVGAGGAGGTVDGSSSTPGVNGSNSTVVGLTAIGGGYGGAWNSSYRSGAPSRAA